MKLETLRYIKNTGWSVGKFPDLDSENTLILIFSAPDLITQPGLIQDLVKHYPSSKIIGCSTAGEIFGKDISDHSLSVAIIRFDNTEIKIAKMKVENVNSSYQVGKDLVTQLDSPELRSIFILSEGLKINGSELTKGLSETNNQVLISGGLAADSSSFKQTWVIHNGEILQDHIVGVGFYGSFIHIGHGSRGGWDIFGLERRVTRSKHNILYELDNRPALKLYKEYLGDKASGLPATGLLYPLAIRQNEADQNHLVRTILGIDEKEQSLIFAGDIPMGYLAQLMRANFDRIITGANDAAMLATSSLFSQGNGIPSEPILCIAVSCVGRRLLLGERTEEEIEATLEALPANTQQIGFYSYGEISPYEFGVCDLHNQTMTLTILYEK